MAVEFLTFDKDGGDLLHIIGPPQIETRDGSDNQSEIDNLIAMRAFFIGQGRRAV